MSIPRDATEQQAHNEDLAQTETIVADDVTLNDVPKEEEIELALYEADNLTEEEYDSMSEKELENFHEKAKKIVKERMNE